MTVAVPPDVAYAAVSDVRTVGTRSPETVAVTLRGAALPLAVGARFTGHNRNGIFRWSTRCTVTEAEPGRVFAFDVKSGGLAISNWRYEFSAAPDGDATLVSETWTDRRSPVMYVLSTLVTGVRDRPAHNRRTIRATLDALKASLEATQEAGATGEAADAE
ncbi:SRPBCC family protein [Yinghuangia soli]|uniref:SRPBCC family protein n=1 Tax=Yinghuangia soli TaxID=2908204 RepID=A0AA41Q137_9ACTN|nr:SRPBCC family protein [Yinghuangia soli]MCF2528846.1 SRPBCC family protein [Yinghuangia soli]